MVKLKDTRRSPADKVILITGAGKGSGRILALSLARHGAIIAANDISPVNVDEVVNQIIEEGGNAKAYVDDVAKKLGVQTIVQQVEDDFGHIDILINHAAVDPHVLLLDMDEWDWHRVLDVNLTGTFLMTQSVGRLMRLQGSGIIINLIHGAAGATALVSRSLSNEDHTAAFIASMSALEAFTQQAARELGRDGIQVHSMENIPEKIVERVLALLEIQAEE